MIGGDAFDDDVKNDADAEPGHHWLADPQARQLLAQRAHRLKLKL